MSLRPARSRAWLVTAALVGLGFALAWRCTARNDAPMPAPRAPRPAPREPARPIAPPERRVAATSERRAARDPLAVRRSELGEWMRFRNDHPALAMSAEMAVRWRINTPLGLREVAQACADTLHAAQLPDLGLSAELALRGRVATVRGWGCDGDDAPGADRFCDCLLEHLPPELEAVIPDEVPDEALASYEGLMSLRLWRL